MARLLTSPTVAGSLILQARLRAELSQRELSGRAATAQSTIAAYERGHKQPTLETLMRLLHAAGFDLRMRLEPHDDHDETLAAWRETLAGEDRDRYQHDEAEIVAGLKAAQGWT